jgi:CRP/FNR family transcriptional regulator
MSEATAPDLLAAVPLLGGYSRAELADLAGRMRRRTLDRGDLLWRQGDAAREMVFVLDGRLSASMQVAGERAVEIGTAGPGDTVGEIALLDGGGHTMSVHAAEPTTLLALGRTDLAALLAAPTPAAFALNRGLALLLTARHRNQLVHLARSLGEGAGDGREADPSPPFAELEECAPPDSRYVRRMATFHDFDPLALWGFLTSGSYARCPKGRMLLAEGAPSAACFLTMNGAVEQVLVRGDRRMRVALAGPGKAFGYPGLIDGGPSPVAAVTRERTLLLVLPRDRFHQLFTGEDAVSHVFLDVIRRDLLATLRQTLRPHARLAASV